MNMLNRFCETRFTRLHLHAALFAGALLLSSSLVAHADDIQDANKLFKQGQHSQALDKVNNYLSGKPKDAQARFLKGLILTEQGKIADAIKIFSGLTEDYPELPEPYNNLAVLYASQGQYDKAKQALEMAIRTHPSYATAHENLGDIYAKMASQAYDRALQLDRSNTSTQTKLAMIQDLFSGNARPKSTATRNVATGIVSSGKPAVATAPAPTPAPVPAPAAPEPVAVAPAPVKPVAVAPVAAPAKPAAPEKVVAVAPQPKPAAEKAAPEAANHESDVLKTVNAWAEAWSSKNVKKYLAFYAPDFDTPDGESRSSWAETRKERIGKPKSIHVGISDATVKFTDSTHATVQFRQSYRASHMHTSSHKTLLMVKSGGKWLIQEERAK
ncbi:MAG TPA: tetratricopeptide repeat protein [Gallionella sp.]|nr:tetratricopeptide repeat protein [Gallionella sp.]